MHKTYTGVSNKTNTNKRIACDVIWNLRATRREMEQCIMGYVAFLYPWSRSVAIVTTDSGEKARRFTWPSQDGDHIVELMLVCEYCTSFNYPAATLRHPVYGFTFN